MTNGRALRAGDTVLIGGQYADDHGYTSIVGKQGIVRADSQYGSRRIYVNVKDKRDLDRKWYIITADAQLLDTEPLNRNYRHLLSKEGY